MALTILAWVGFASCARRSGEPAPEARAAKAAPDEVVARVAGKPITMAELDRRAAGGLERVRYEEYEVRRQVLEQLVTERILEAEAASRGLTKEAYLKAEIEDKVTAPSREDVTALYDQHRARFGGRALEDVYDDLARALKERRRGEHEAILRHELRSQTKVAILLKEPRTNVAIPAEAPSLGPATAPVTVVEFLDYQCPYCHKVQGIVDDMLTQYEGKLRFVHREFLLGSPRAMPAARAARCAGDQKRFWEYHRRLLTEGGDRSDADLQKRAVAIGLDGSTFATCLASERHDATIRRSVEQGTELGVSGTPTFFINGRRLVGVRSLQEFREVIDAELKEKS